MIPIFTIMFWFCTFYFKLNTQFIPQERVWSTFLIGTWNTLAVVCHFNNFRFCAIFSGAWYRCWAGAVHSLQITISCDISNDVLSSKVIVQSLQFMRFFILFLFTNTQGFSTATFPFSVSHKIDLLNQLNASNGTMNNNQRTLEIIREDLASSAMNESEGTCWDSGHRHLFVVMGASVKSLFLMSLLYQNNDFYFIF